MDMILRRKSYNSWGIISTLESSGGEVLFHTLEHSYLQPDNSYEAKINRGHHPCKLGKHELEGMIQPFETYEITGVPNHSNLLFHWGNYNKDSEGCVLIGMNQVDQMVTESRLAFSKFIELQAGKDFYLLVI